MVRKTSPRVAQSPGCLPLLEMYRQAVHARPSRWTQVEAPFLRAMAGLKTIDLKAEWARNAGQGGGPTSDLLTWLRQSKPLSFLFLAIRVVDEADFKRTLFFANAANRMMDDVGLVAYEPGPTGEGY